MTIQVEHFSKGCVLGNIQNNYEKKDYDLAALHVLSPKRPRIPSHAKTLLEACHELKIILRGIPTVDGGKLASRLQCRFLTAPQPPFLHWH